MSLDALASAASMSKSYLWELENRDSLNPTTEKVTALATVFELPVSYFLDETIDAPKQTHLDQSFFRSYEKLDEPDKAQLLKYMKTFLGSK